MAVLTLAETFARLYVINLPERQDRRRAVLKELNSLKIGADCPNLEIFAAIRPDSAGEFPSLGARGCYLSHLAILKAARDRQLANLLIMEDDLGFSPLFVKHQSEILAELFSDAARPWDFLYLGHVLPPAVAGATAPGQVDWHITQATLQTTHCLAINGAILDRLITFLEQLLSRPAGHPDGGPMHVDGAYSTGPKPRDYHPGGPALFSDPVLFPERCGGAEMV
jgi:glycosyl transferase, family 25